MSCQELASKLHSLGISDTKLADECFRTRFAKKPKLKREKTTVNAVGRRKVRDLPY